MMDHEHDMLRMIGTAIKWCVVEYMYMHCYEWCAAYIELTSSTCGHMAE